MTGQQPQMQERERRTFALDGLKVEKRADGQGFTVRGHAAVFNQWSEDLGGFRERIAPGAFRKVIGRDDVRALFNHDENYVLARTRAGTLKLNEDERGLRFVAEAPPTTWAKDLAISMQRGDVTQASFRFRIAPEGQEWHKNGETWERTITEVSRLWDVSIVTYAAYPQTDAALRALQDARAARGARPPADEELRIRVQRQRLRQLEIEEELRREMDPDARQEAQRRRLAKISEEFKR